MEKRRGHKRGRMMGGEGILGFAFILVWLWFWSICFERKVEKGERREGEYCLSWTHTTSWWNWARRVKEPVEVS